MKRPDTIMIEGRAYSWRAILELRRAQIQAWKAAQPHQHALFELREARGSLANSNSHDGMGASGTSSGWREAAQV